MLLTPEDSTEKPYVAILKVCDRIRTKRCRINCFSVRFEILLDSFVVSDFAKLDGL